MGVEDLDPADAASVQARFIGDRPNDVPGLDPITPAHFNPVTVHVRLGGGGRTIGPGPRPAAVGSSRIGQATTVTGFPVIALGRLAQPLLLTVHQQGLLTDRHPQGRQGELIRGGLQLLGDALEDFGEQGPFLISAGGGADLGGELFPEPIQTVLVDGGIAGNVHRFDRTADSPFHPPKETAFARSEEQNRVSGATGTAGASDAMHIGLAVERDVVIDHEGDPLDIQTPSRHIGGHQHIDTATAQALDRALPLGLGNVAVEDSHVVTVLLQGFSHGEGDGLGAGENDHALPALRFKHPLQGLEFVRSIHRQIALTNAG